MKKLSDVNIGGKGWLLTLFGACIFLVGGPWWQAGFLNAGIASLMDQLGQSREAILHTHTIIAFIIIVANFFVPAIYKALKPKWTNILIMVVEAIAIAITGMATSLALYAIARFFVLFGAQAVCQVGIGAIYGRYFPTKKGFVLGWATVGASATNFVTLPVMAALLPKVGFTGTMFIFAGWVILMALIQLIFIPNDPEKMNYVPDNGAPLSTATETFKNNAENAYTWTLKDLIKSGTFWQMAIAYGIFIAMSAAYMAQLVPHLVMNGVEQLQAIGYISIMGIIGMISSAISGIVDQAIGTRKTSIIMGCSYGVAMLIFGVLPFTMPTTLISLFLFCIVMGAVSNLGPSHYIAVFGPKNFVNVQGYAMVIAGIIAAPTTSILAFSSSATGSFKTAYLIFAIMDIIAIILVATAPDLMKKETGQKAIRLRVKKGQEIVMGKAAQEE